MSRLLRCATFAVLATLPSAASDDGEREPTRFVMTGALSGAVQCDDGACAGAIPFQPEFGLELGRMHEFRVKFGFAAGDHLDEPESRFNLDTWAADLESDVEDINGRGRDHLLTAWYRFSAELAEDSTFEFSVGLIDATDYMDDNAFSGDEYTQFMNPALVNGPNVFLPSYDFGLVLGWTSHHWSARALYMDIGENDDGNPYRFAGGQLAYHAHTAWGEGTYRLVLDTTDAQFLDPGGGSLERRSAILISCDQQLGRNLGGFLRIGRQTDDAAVDYAVIYSGGVSLSGGAWKRERDTLGVGYAHLGSGNGELLRSRVFEAYYRVALNELVSITPDVQYLTDERRDGSSPSGTVVGLRVTVSY